MSDATQTKPERDNEAGGRAEPLVGRGAWQTKEAEARARLMRLRYGWLTQDNPSDSWRVLSSPNVKPGPPPVAVPERNDGAATGGRAEAIVGRFIGSGKRNVVCPLFFSTPSR
jgi:hypothetical protein